MSTSALPNAAFISTLVSPVCLAMAIVLSAVSSKHEPLARVRSAWILVITAAGCATVALTFLAHHKPA
jgi:hypothetical protein